MSEHGLAEAIELALGELRSGPPLGAFGIAREDCALVHIDYFLSIQIAAHLLADALAHARNVPIWKVYAEFAPKDTPCDCASCVGEAEAKAALEKHIASYTNVKAWHQDPEAPSSAAQRADRSTNAPVPPST